MTGPAAGTTRSVEPPGAPMNAPSIERWSIASRAAASLAYGTVSKPTCFATAAASGAGPTTPTWRSRGFGECNAPTYELTNAACTRRTTSNASPSSLYPVRRGAGSAGCPAVAPLAFVSLALIWFPRSVVLRPLTISHTRRGSEVPAPVVWSGDSEGSMTGTANAGPGLGHEVVGREAELAKLHAFLARGSRSTGLLLVGGPGIGKTTLWENGVDAARQRGLRVLVARPSDAEARLAFSSLIDLFDGVASEELAGLPPPQLHALEIALLRAASAGDAPETHAVGVGCLNAFRALATKSTRS